MISRYTHRLLLWPLFFLTLSLFLLSCDRQENPKVKISLSDVDNTSQIIQDESVTPTLRIAIAAVISPKETFVLYKDLLDYISDKLDMSITLIQRETYEEVNFLVKDNELDLAFVCSGAYIDGHDQFDMELLVAPVAYGKPVYHGYIIVPANSKVTTVEGLRGKRFAFTDPMSNTGKLSPTYILAQMNENIESFFSEYIFTYNHDKSIEMVAHALVDGAAVDGLIWEYMNSQDQTLTAQTKIINKSEPYGIPPIVIPSGLDPALKKTLREIFLNIHTDEEGMKILTQLQIDKFVVLDDQRYDSIRKMRAWFADK